MLNEHTWITYSSLIDVKLSANVYLVGCYLNYSYSNNINGPSLRCERKKIYKK